MTPLWPDKYLAAAMLLIIIIIIIAMLHLLQSLASLSQTQMSSSCSLSLSTPFPHLSFRRSTLSNRCMRCGCAAHFRHLTKCDLTSRKAKHWIRYSNTLLWTPCICMLGMWLLTIYICMLYDERASGWATQHCVRRETRVISGLFL